LNDARTDSVPRFQTYICSSILLYNAMQLKLYGRSEKDWTKSINLARKALVTLDSCRSMAPIARSFATTVHSYLEAFDSAPAAHWRRGLSAQVYSHAGLTSPSQQQASRYLFVRPAGGDEGLHRASCELFDVLCRPISQHGTSTSEERPMGERGEDSSQGLWPLPSWPYLLGTGHAAEQLLSQTVTLGSKVA